MRVYWAGNDFWYPSMRRPPNTPSPSELRKKIAPQFSEAIDLAGQKIPDRKPPKFLLVMQN